MRANERQAIRVNIDSQHANPHRVNGHRLWIGRRSCEASATKFWLQVPQNALLVVSKEWDRKRVQESIDRAQNFSKTTTGFREGKVHSNILILGWSNRNTYRIAISSRIER